MTKHNEIHPSDIWSKDKADFLVNFIENQSALQSPERLIKNKMLAIQYQIEDYLESNLSDEIKSIAYFVKLYIKAFNVSQSKVAKLFQMQESNFCKYINGERKLNSSFIIKISELTQTNPEYWLRIEAKSKLWEIQKEKKDKKHEEYTLSKLLSIE